MALVGEIGELCECFQWKKDPESQPGLPAWSNKDKEHLGEELSDVGSHKPNVHSPPIHPAAVVFVSSSRQFLLLSNGHMRDAGGAAQVLLYLLRLADRCNIDLPAAALRKLEKNAKKYPAHLVNGSRSKYTVYETEATSKDDTEAPDAKRHRSA